MSQNDTLARATRYADRLTSFLVSKGSLPQDEVVNTLQKLEKLDISLPILTSTGIGKKVNELRKKSVDEKARKLCKALIQKWKTLLEGSSSSSPSGDGPQKRKLAPDEYSSSPVHAASSSQQNSDSQHSLTMSSPSNTADSEESNDAVLKKVRATENGTASSSGSQQKAASSTTSQEAASKGAGRNNFPTTGNPIRQGFREMLLTSLRSHEPWPQDALDPVEIAGVIEDGIFESCPGKNPDDLKYKNKVRAKVKALRDSKNPALREMILTGAISATKFVEMTAEEMASDEVKALRKKLTDEAITSHQLAVQQGTETEMFKCSKCKSTKCTYTQLQTRSSDEPMTTFVCCLACGNRWKVLYAGEFENAEPSTHLMWALLASISR